MRGADTFTESLFSMRHLDDFVPASHPLRPIRQMVNEALVKMDALLGSEADIKGGRPSMAPEKLLRAMLLQIFYSLRSERQLMEQTQYNLLFRWFIGLSMDDAVWVPSAFRKNRERLIAHDAVIELFNQVLEMANEQDLLSGEHFSVDGTLIEAWAGHKSFVNKNGCDGGDGGNFKGQSRSNDTHESTTDGDARLYPLGTPRLAGRMNWLAQLSLDYTQENGRSVARFSHQGPLRILQSLYPEGDAICHNVLVHPPSGLVGGDTLDMRVTVGAGAHGLVTTPGASRFYRSEAGLATQQVHATLHDGARLEWFPLEAIAYSGCDALNKARFELAPTAELMTWDTTALGLPNANQPFATGRFQQHLEIPGPDGPVWLERGTVNAQDERLMNGPLGLAGQRCMATLVFAAGSAIAPERVEAALDAARAALEASPLRLQAGATQPHPQVIVLRVLAPVVEPAMQLLRPVWAAWRQVLWGLPGNVPRLWNL